MTEIEKLEEELSKEYIISEEPWARSFIFPDGKFLQIPKWNTTHASIDSYLKKKGLIPEDYENTSGCSYIEDLGVIRVNLEKEGFIVLSKVRPTPSQYDSLIKFLDSFKRSCMYRYREQFYIFEPQPSFTPHGFSDPRNLDTDEVISVIKRYYTTGKIIEERKEN